VTTGIAARTIEGREELATEGFYTADLGDIRRI
jgi:hypothetical protein